jgi:hypothetical protein
MALTALEICSRALIKIGAAPITDFTDGSAEADIAGLLYLPVRNALISSYPWSFALKQAVLAPSLTPPTADFSKAFTLPGDCLRVWSAGQAGRGQGMRYRVMGKALHTDADSVTLTYIGSVLEADMPPFADMALITKLAAEFCIPLTENTQRAEALTRMAEQEIAKARSIDAQQDSATALQSFTLTDVR